MGEQILVIIGAGPKAVTTAVKASFMHRLGHRVPRIVIVEKHGVGAHWSGCHGYTDGHQPLGTSPAKDLGFPYQSTDVFGGAGAEIDTAMLQISWQSFLAHEGMLADWIDRGLPAPTHRRWSDYLKWAFSKVSDCVELIRARATSVDLEDERWALRIMSANGVQKTIYGDALMMTGPGKVHLPAGLVQGERIHTVGSFWRQFSKSLPQTPQKVTIAGGGEMAAAIGGYLSQKIPNCDLEFIAQGGAIFSRGESYLENRVYSDAESSGWGLLTEQQKRDFVAHTDRGVFSVAVMGKLNGMGIVRTIPGVLMGATESTTGVLMQVEQAGTVRSYSTDLLVVAIGADPVADIVDLLSPQARHIMASRLNLMSLSAATLEPLIEEDLSIRGPIPKLHLPAISVLNQGPGFANLSCLGRISDRVLSSYVRLAPSLELPVQSSRSIARGVCSQFES